MKKFLAILAIATVFAACGNSANDTTVTDTTTTTSADTTTIPGAAVAPATGDTTLKVVDTNAMQPADTMHK